VKIAICAGAAWNGGVGVAQPATSGTQQNYLENDARLYQTQNPAVVDTDQGYSSAQHHSQLYAPTFPQVPCGPLSWPRQYRDLLFSGFCCKDPHNTMVATEVLSRASDAGGRNPLV